MKNKKSIIAILVIVTITVFMSSCATQHSKCAAYGGYSGNNKHQTTMACKSW